MCGQREDAEEVAQDTLLKVSQNWRQLQDPSASKPWTLRSPADCCLMKRRKRVFGAAAEIPAEDLPLSPPPTPDPKRSSSSRRSPPNSKPGGPPPPARHPPLPSSSATAKRCPPAKRRNCSA
jgi:hypothetical protein